MRGDIANFNQDFISYPNDVGDMMQHLWDQAARHNLTEDDVQKGLQMIADWVSTCERAAPTAPPLDGFK